MYGCSVRQPPKWGLALRLLFVPRRRREINDSIHWGVLVVIVSHALCRVDKR